jgi:hypothetical protein
MNDLEQRLKLICGKFIENNFLEKGQQEPYHGWT